jgi:hypothetical protein
MVFSVRFSLFRFSFLSDGKYESQSDCDSTALIGTDTCQRNSLQVLANLTKIPGSFLIKCSTIIPDGSLIATK